MDIVLEEEPLIYSKEVDHIFDSLELGKVVVP